MCNLNLQNKMKNETPLTQTTMTIEESLHRYLKTFWPLIHRIMDTNTMIGGTFALWLHGLRMASHPDDLDLIIYYTTEDQKKVLRSISFFDQTPDKYKNTEENRSFKFYKDGKVLNIVCAVPEDTDDKIRLGLYYEGDFIKVQNIESVIHAKKKYARAKDLQHFIDLKNLNF